MDTKFTLRDMLQIVGLIVALAMAWSALDKRLTVLELNQRYLHGDVSLYVKESK